MRHIIPISGKDSLAAAIVQMTREPDLPYEFIYNDTQMELPETYAWIELVEKTLGISIVRAGKSLLDIIHEQGILPSPRRRFCTKYSKIFPMRDWLKGDDATLYIGIRADEDRMGSFETSTMAVRYPLKEAQITLPMVYQIDEKKGLMPPAFFWKRVHDAVRGELGVLAYVIDELPRYVFDRAFAWRSRPNCFMCFYQRRYEWAGLLEFHPELFEEAEKLEREYGESNATREHPYYFIGDDIPLSVIRARSDELVQKRIDFLVKTMRARAQQDLWKDSLFDEMELAQKSCGLFCGK